MAALQKAIAVANSYHGCALRRCNEAKLIADALAAHESHDGVAEVRKAFQKVREAAQAADESFSAVLLKVTKDDEVTTYKGRAEEVSTGDRKTDPKRTDPRRTDPRRTEPRRTDPKELIPRRTDPKEDRSPFQLN